MSTHHPLSARAQAMFEVIERYQASGQTQKAFCQSEALALSTLQYWLRTLSYAEINLNIKYY